jgi:trehalose/maltose hydrolase-like predicted phosphorylase
MDRSVRRGLALIAVVLIAIVAMLLVPKHTAKVTHPPNDDPWVLVSYDPNNPVGTYLGNGFISTRIMGDGVGSQDGKPLPCFMAGLYDDEKLIPIPTWSDLRSSGGFSDGGDLSMDKTAPYEQALDMRNGILTTQATWGGGDETLRGRIEVIVSRAQPGTALIRATLLPAFDGVVGVRYGDSDAGNPNLVGMQTVAVHGKEQWASYWRTRQSGLTLVIAHQLIMESGSSWRGPRKDPHLQDMIGAKAGQPLTILWYTSAAVGVDAASVKARALADLDRAVNAKAGFIVAHKAAWAKLWQRDIIIDGPRKDQQALHSCMFYILQSVREGSQWSIPPLGLSDNGFSGHVFWDADTWMFQALILQHPELARSIVDYRFNTLPGAMANAKASGYAGAEYAWESGMTGKEDTPPGLVYRNERHIDGDVALAQWQYFLATGDLKWLKTRGFPVIKATADYWASRAVPANGRYEIKHIVPPDENADFVDNSAYTNAIAKMNLDIASRAAKLAGTSANPKWSEVAAKLYIPFDAKAKRFIAFDGYKGWKTKQADTELLAYPLQFVLSRPEAVSKGRQDMTAIYRNTLDFYAPKVEAKGPAMTYSAHSVIEARLGQCDKAYSDFLRSYKPYLRGPFNYFNETPSEFRTNYCFLTGCSGPIQAAIYGFAGIRMDYASKDPSKAALTYTPCLPKQWKSMKITGVQWHGKVFDVTVTRGGKAEISPTRQGDR